MTTLVSDNDVRAAYERIRAVIHRTPIIGSARLGKLTGLPSLSLKCENFQKTGSFKVRGALNHVLTMADADRAKGVVTISAGNHAQAVAWAADSVGVASTVVMPAGASETKAAASRGYGAEVIIDGPVAEAFELVHKVAAERGMSFLHPFDAPQVIAGQGTVGLEILEQVPDVRTIVVPLGGGGLISGICASVSERPDVRVWGVEPEGAAAMRLSLDRGVASRLDRVDTIADGLAPPMAGDLTFEHVRTRVEDVVTVSDEEIAQAMRLIMSRTKVVVEPAGAAAVAALLSSKVPTESGGSVVAVLSGGNVDLDRLPQLLGEH